jgi:hypothetical protein
MDMITDPMFATYINVHIWLQATQEGTLNTSDFYVNVADMLDNIEQATVLNLALSMSSYAKERERVFWLTLFSLDKSGEVYGKAIVASANTFDKEMLADEILEYRLENGINEYNQVVDGIFESISVPINEDEGIDCYIYTIAE